MQTVTAFNEGTVKKTVQTGLTAAGTTQAAAFLFSTAGFYEFASVAQGAIAQLPSISTPGIHEIDISLPAGNGMIIYPPSGGTINSLGTNNPGAIQVSPQSGEVVRLWQGSPGAWYSERVGPYIPG
jgi:hypothetical protein